MAPLMKTRLLNVIGIFLTVPVVYATYQQIADAVDKYELPNLPFVFEGLEPYIDSETVKVHYEGHHATYTSNLNNALAAWRAEFPNDKLARKSILYILQNIEKVPEKYRTTIRNQGGGYLNHCIYWAGLSSNTAGTERQPSGALWSQIMSAFGSLENFYDSFTEQAKKLFGSGYVWLSRNEAGELVITTTANQDSPVSEGLQPLLCLDVWEHAYYLKFQYRRPVYVEHWWKLVDWKAIEGLDMWWKVLATTPKDEL